MDIRAAGVAICLSLFLPASATGVAINQDVDGSLEVASLAPDGSPVSPGWPYDMSPRGRFVVFADSGAIYRRDLRTGSTEQLGLPRRLEPRGLDIAPGGRFIALLDTDVFGPPGDTRLVADLHLHDVRRDNTRRVLRIADRVGGAILSQGPSLGDGARYLAFATRDPDLARHETNKQHDVFVFDRRDRELELASATSRGRTGNAFSRNPSLSADGRSVVFASRASNLVPGDTNGAPDIFLRDLDAGVTSRVSIALDGRQGGDGSAAWPTISADEGTVAFIARARSLDPDATDDGYEIFVHDVAAGTTTRMAPGSAGGDSYAPSLSEDGRYVAYSSTREGITDTPGCGEGTSSVYLHDRIEGTTTCLSPSLDLSTDNGSGGALVDATGEVVLFASGAPLLPEIDPDYYLYLWRRAAGDLRRGEPLPGRRDSPMRTRGARATADPARPPGRLRTAGSTASEPDPRGRTDRSWPGPDRPPSPVTWPATTPAPPRTPLRVHRRGPGPAPGSSPRPPGGGAAPA